LRPKDLYTSGTTSKLNAIAQQNTDFLAVGTTNFSKSSDAIAVNYNTMMERVL